MIVAERIAGPSGSPRRTRSMIWICMVSLLAAMIILTLWFVSRDAANTERNAAQDKAIQQQVTDANGYRKALASKGVNPNSIAPPPEVRTAPLASLPAAAPPIVIPGPSGPAGKPGAAAPVVPGPAGSPGPTGPAPACASEPTACVGPSGGAGTNGQDGAPGKDGKDGTNGMDGRSIASIMLRPSGAGECELYGTYSDGSQWVAGGATIPCLTTPDPTPTVNSARRSTGTQTPAAHATPAPTPLPASKTPAPKPTRRVPPLLPLDWTIMLLTAPFGVRRFTP